MLKFFEKFSLKFFRKIIKSAGKYKGEEVGILKEKVHVVRANFGVFSQNLVKIDQILRFLGINFYMCYFTFLFL